MRKWTKVQAEAGLYTYGDGNYIVKTPGGWRVDFSESLQKRYGVPHCSYELRTIKEAKEYF